MAVHAPALPRAMAIIAGLALAFQAGCSDRALPTGVHSFRPAYSQTASSPVVNSLDDVTDESGCDDTHCSLREAIAYATSGATITFAEVLTAGGPQTITLAQGAFFISGNVTINGPGAGKLTIDANAAEGSASPVLSVWTTAAVSISGLTITGGYHGDGGGIKNQGTLTLSDMVVTGNQATSTGGGIWNQGTLTVSYSTVSNNSATWGGGIRNEGVLVLDHSTVSGNTASSLGWGTGGGIATGPSETAGIVTTVRNSTISGNTAHLRGGGIDNQNLLRIEHSTITGNSVQDSDGASGNGGGGVASYLANDPAIGAEMVGSIVWGNFGEGGVPEDVTTTWDEEPFGSLGHNLIGAAGYGIVLSEDFAATGDLTGVSDAKLGPLAVNVPGKTATHALLAGSPAIDAGSCTGLDGATVATDQRGVSRPASACDIGAYEVSTAPPPSSFTSSCTYTIHPKNGSYTTTVSWSNADPGVTKIVLTDGRTITKSLAPTAAGSWSTTVRSSAPSYQLWGGTSRKDASTELKASTACVGAGG